MIKLVCSDIDNTLRKNKDGGEVLRKLKAKGVLTMLATGRSVADVFEMYPEAREKTLVASYDGAIVTLGDTVILDRPIDDSIVKAFFDSFPRSGLPGCSLIFYTAADCFIIGDSAERALRNANTMRGRVKKISDPREIRQKIYKISVYSDTDRDFDYLFADWESYLNCVYRRGNWCEFVSKNTDKGYALSIVMEKYMLSRDEVLAIGDGENDFTMLEVAGCSYAVEGSAAAREEKGSFVTSDAVRTINELVLKD